MASFDFKERYQEGLIGEQIIRGVLESKGEFDYFEHDYTAVRKKDGKCFSIEVKFKYKFVPPPFYGQGIDLHRLETRVKFCQERDIIPYFVVVDKGSYEDDKSNFKIYHQFLGKLLDIYYKDVKANVFNRAFCTENNIVIFNIDPRFEVWNILNKTNQLSLF